MCSRTILDIRSVFRRSLWLFVIFAGVLAPNSEADFVTPYALGDFTLVNSANANGAATSPDGGHTLILTGPNDGSGVPGYTEFTVISKGFGQLHFSFSYASLDSPGSDSASYLVNGQSHPLADANGVSGVVNVAVQPGVPVGFRVDTVDNQAEPGVLTITNFSLPTAATVPAVSPSAAVCLVMMLAASGLWFMRRNGRADRVG